MLGFVIPPGVTRPVKLDFGHPVPELVEDVPKFRSGSFGVDRSNCIEVPILVTASLAGCRCCLAVENTVVNWQSYDIAGQKRANWRGMQQAMSQAAALASSRKGAARKPG